MKRYFEVKGQQRVFALDLHPPANSMSIFELERQLKLPLKEIEKGEYLSLLREYGQSERRLNP